MLLAPSISGLFKRRQFDPAVLLLAVGWYLAFFAFAPRRGGIAGRPRRARRSRHGMAMGPVLRPGNATTLALKTQLNQRQLARGRDLHPGQEQVGSFALVSPSACRQILFWRGIGIGGQ